MFHDKATDRTIVGSFPLGCEETAWKLLHLPVIGDALATSSLAVTGFISTRASDFVFFQMTFQHLFQPFLKYNV